VTRPDARPDRFVVENQLELWLLLREASAVLGWTAAAGPSPGLWSGPERAIQRLEVEVERVLCGAETRARLTLDLPLVSGSRTSDDRPRLAPWLTAPNARAIYLLSGGGIVDEDLGVLSGTEANIRWVESACRGPMPKGTPALFLLIARVAGTKNDVTEALRSAGSAVLDVIDDDELIVRMTVSSGALAVYSGLRAHRLSSTRPPDGVLRGSADELGRWLLGQAPRPPLEGQLSPAFWLALDGIRGAVAREHAGEIERLIDP
jgi:hypothetical protein